MLEAASRQPLRRSRRARQRGGVTEAFVNGGRWERVCDGCGTVRGHRRCAEEQGCPSSPRRSDYERRRWGGNDARYTRPAICGGGGDRRKWGGGPVAIMAGAVRVAGFVGYGREGAALQSSTVER